MIKEESLTDNIVGGVPGEIKIRIAVIIEDLLVRCVAFLFVFANQDIHIKPLISFHFVSDNAHMF